VEPDAFKLGVTAAPETGADIGVQFNVPERREEGYATQHEREELKQKRQLHNAVVPRERLDLFLALHLARNVFKSLLTRITDLHFNNVNTCTFKVFTLRSHLYWNL